jgi:hypothetical protein
VERTLSPGSQAEIAEIKNEEDAGGGEGVTGCPLRSTKEVQLIDRALRPLWWSISELLRFVNEAMKMFRA